MAVVNTKGTAITTGDTAPTANPSQSIPLKIHGGRLKESLGVIAAASGDSIGSTYRLVRLPSSARVSQVLLTCSAITTCAADVGLYDTEVNGGAVVDADFFASAQSVASALVNSDVTHEAAVFAITDVEKPLWKALGLTSDPGKLYDVVATLTAAAGAAGTVGLKVRYVDGN